MHFTCEEPDELLENGYAVIDLETTGLGKQDVIVEVGIVLANEHGEITDILETLIRPTIFMRATEIHGITEDMVRHSPTFEIMTPQILAALDGRQLVAHNAGFESRFLAKELAETGVLINESNFVDTLKLSRKLKKTPNHKLATIASYYGITIDNPHHAISDALATALVLKKFIQEEQIDRNSLSSIPFYGSPELAAINKTLWQGRERFDS